MLCKIWTQRSSRPAFGLFQYYYYIVLQLILEITRYVVGEVEDKTDKKEIPVTLRVRPRTLRKRVRERVRVRTSPVHATIDPERYSMSINIYGS